MYIDPDGPRRQHGIHDQRRTVVCGQGPQSVQIVAESRHVAHMRHAYRNGLVVNRLGHVVQVNRAVPGLHERHSIDSRPGSIHG